MKAYICTITYNFDSDYVIRKCDTYKDAVKTLNALLEEEIQIVRNESGYEPSVIEYTDDDKMLIYCEGRTKENTGRPYISDDDYIAFYRIFELEI